MVRRADWPRVSVEEVCESIVDCVNKTAPVIVEPTPYKMIRTTNVRDGWVDLTSVRCVTAATFEKWTRRQKPRRGDVILTREAPLGEVGLLRSDESVFLGQRLVAYRADPGKLDNRFLLYAMLGDDMQGQIRSMGSGATVEHMRVPDCEKVTLRLPPLGEQRRIASILSAYDDLIENNTRRIAILEEMARRIYEEWFIRFRFPGHEGVRMVESELGLVPEGWSVAPLGDVVKLLSGFAFKSSTFSEDGSFGLVTIKNVHDGEFVEECTSRLSDPPLNMPQHCNLNVADILLSLTGNVGRCCLVTLAGCLLNQRVAKIEPIKSFDWAYSYLLFRSIQHRERLEAIANGVAQQNLSPVESQRMRLVIPAEAMRRRFAEVVTHLLRLRLTLDLKNTNLRTTRDLLLPKLISGELDVSSLPEPEALAA